MLRFGFLLLLGSLFIISCSTTQFNAEDNAELKNTIRQESWFVEGYQHYQPRPEILDPLAKEMEGISVLIFLGMWCSDSQREVPHFYKIADQLKFEKFELIALDRSKTSPEKTEQKYDIEFVPTFIFFRGEKELGRIVEVPKGYLEENILSIVKSK